jgi:predicted dehydrogenase
MPENPEHQSTRRTFIKSSVAAAGLSLASLPARSQARVPGANDRIQVGVIGTGGRGRDALMREFHQFDKDQNVEITAICDTWRISREKAAALTKEWYNKDVRSFVDHQELLALQDIDAVMIASCDHQHARMLCDAVHAGKDAYCEKPVAMTMEDLNKAYDAVKETKRITQLGTQLRSWASFTGCKALYETGALGKVTKIEQARNGASPYWFGFVKDVKEQDVDWPRFLFGRAPRPFSADQYSAWYGYRDFTAGPHANLMVHFIDLVHYITGAKFPTSAVTHGGLYAYKGDGRDCPDNVQTLLDYPEGFLVSYSSNLSNGSGSRTHFYGTQGMMDLTEWNKPTVTGAAAHDSKKLGGDVKPIEHVNRDHHMLNWLKCLRTRESANADMLTAGYSHGVAVILSDRAWVEGRRMVFDPAKREIRPG